METQKLDEPKTEFDLETDLIELHGQQAYHYLMGFLAHAGFAEGSYPKRELDVLWVEYLHYLELRKGKILP